MMAAFFSRLIGLLGQKTASQPTPTGATYFVQQTSGSNTVFARQY